MFDGRKISFQIASNGTLLTDEFVSWFVQSPDTWLNVTLNGPPEIHDRLRLTIKGEPTHAHILQGLHRLREANESIFRNRLSFVCNFAMFAEVSKQMEWFLTSPEVGCRLPKVVRRISLESADSLPSEDFHVIREFRNAEKCAMNLLETRYIEGIKLKSRSTNYPKLLWDGDMTTLHYRSMNPLLWRYLVRRGSWNSSENTRIDSESIIRHLLLMLGNKTMPAVFERFH
jgi:sulfatase maturation enzyme AslB (radical SAM superfamily)